MRSHGREYRHGWLINCRSHSAWAQRRRLTDSLAHVVASPRSAERQEIPGVIIRVKKKRPRPRITVGGGENRRPLPMHRSCTILEGDDSAQLKLEQMAGESRRLLFPACAGVGI
jgi:hypothetical protein